MATGLGLPYSPPSPLEFPYTDTTSSIYPDRPIRPLPKRRLRSRLSPEVAHSILYPSEGGSSIPLSQTLKEAKAQTNGTPSHARSVVHGSPEVVREASSEPGKDSFHFKGSEVISDDEDSIALMRRYQDAHQPSGTTNSSFTRYNHGYRRNDPARFTKSPIQQSTASSGDVIDGYDSFENTNNKKKRKVPMSGSLGGHQSSLSAEMAQMGISSMRDGDAGQSDADGGVGHYYGSGSSAIPATSTSGNGISGAGRGRYGKAGIKNLSGRTPLGLSINGSNALVPGRSTHPRMVRQPIGAKDGSAASTPDQGIISAAIANAAALPSTPIRGQENVSLLEGQLSKPNSSAKEQFTFTCESESAKSMIWPENHSPSPSVNYNEEARYGSRAGATQNGRDFATQGTQTSPNMLGQHGQANLQRPDVNQQPQQQPRKPRRPLSKQYAIAARERRLRQADNNDYHPPKEEDVWICEFCEYESIFGTPPKALIRQYETKDLRERKRLAEKRRLLEKAKMKGRKGKKGSKNAAKHASTQPQQAPQKQRYDQQPVDPAQMQDYGPQDEEYIPDEYDEDPIAMPSLPPQTPSRIPQPVAQTRNHSLRPPSGTLPPDRKAQL